MTRKTKTRAAEAHMLMPDDPASVPGRRGMIWSVMGLGALGVAIAILLSMLPASQSPNGFESVMARTAPGTK